MKKLFSKATKEATGDSQQSFMGNVYMINSVQYVVEEVIAEGGFAIVFLVKAVKSGNKFALKRLYVNNDHDLAVCKREIQIYSSLGSHKNIITYIDSSINRMPNNIREVLILMLYYKESLINQLTDKTNIGGYGEEELMTIYCDLCEAVSRLHHCQTPIIHRDLKVENVLIGADGSYLLCDFGSATSKRYNPLQYGVQLVEEDLAKYTTLSYRSPEMVDLYSGKTISTKADIWSLGCLFYRLAYLSPAFTESSLAIQSGNYHQPTNHNYSTFLVNLIRYMLTVDTDIRPDIFQVSFLVFKMAGKTCPVANLHNTPVPDINKLPSPEKTVPKQEHEGTKSRSQSSQPTETPTNTTSVIPRERPKASVVHTITPISLINPSSTPRRKKQMLSMMDNNLGASITSETQRQPQLAKPAAKEKIPKTKNEIPKDLQQSPWIQSPPSKPPSTTPETTKRNTETPPKDNAFQAQALQNTPKPPLNHPITQIDQKSFQQQCKDMQEVGKSKNPFLCASSELLPQATSAVSNIFADFVDDQPKAAAAVTPTLLTQQMQNNTNQEVSQNRSLQQSQQQPTQQPHQNQLQQPPTNPQQSEPQQQPPSQPQQQQPQQQQESEPQQQLSQIQQQQHQKQHRRNVSDTSVSSYADKERLSAFRAYKNRVGKKKEKSEKVEGEGSEDEDEEDEDENLEGECIKEGDDDEDEEEDEQPKRPLSADPTSSQDWNPFSDDSLFGMQNDKVNRGSESSILGVKSREDLVMSYADMLATTPSTSDPFSAAPLGPLSRMKKLASKKNKAILEDDASTDATEGYSKLLSCVEDDRPIQLPVDPSRFVMQSESNQLIVTTTSNNPSDASTVTNTVSKAANMSHDLLAGTARLVKKAVGGASDMYKQFVESGTEDNMQDVIVGSVEEGDLEGGRKFQLLSEMRDMLRMGSSTLDEAATVQPAATTVVGSAVATKINAVATTSTATEQIQTSIAEATAVTSETPKSTFIGNILNQFTGNSSTNSAKASNSTFQKFKNSEGSHSISLDSGDIPESSKTLIAVEPVTTTTSTKKSSSKNLVTSIIKNPFTSSKSSSDKDDTLKQTTVKNQASESDKSCGNNVLVISKSVSSSTPTSSSSSSSSSFKNPLKAGFDVFNAAPFRRKKQSQEAKKSTPPSIDSPQFSQPDATDKASKPAQEVRPSQQSPLDQIHPQVKQEKKSSSPMVGYKFSMDSFKFKSSKANFNVLKNESSLDKVPVAKDSSTLDSTTTAAFSTTPTLQQTNYQHQENFADFNSFNSQLSNQSEQVGIVTKHQDQTNNQTIIQQQMDIKEQQQIQKQTQQIEQSNMQQIPQQLKQENRDSPNRSSNFETPTGSMFKQTSIGYKKDIPLSPHNDINIDDEDEEGDDDADILWNKKLKNQDIKPRSKSLFDQSQMIKLAQTENKSKFNSVLSSPEEEKKLQHSAGSSLKNKGQYPSSEFANLGFTDDPDIVYMASSSINLNQSSTGAGSTEAGSNAVAHHTLPRMGSKKRALSKQEEGAQALKGLSESQGCIDTRKPDGLSISQANSSNKVTFV